MRVKEHIYTYCAISASLPTVYWLTNSTGTSGDPGKDDSISQEVENMRITNNPTVLFGPSSELRQVFVLLHFFSRKGLFPPHDGWPRLCFFFPWCSAKCYQRHDKTEPLLENQKKKKKLHTLDNPVRKASCLCHWGPLLKLNYLLSVVITALSINIQGSSY